MTLPLDLFAEVITASGTRYKWDANQPPGSRLQNFSFRTKIGEGFSDGAGQLARRIDQDYPDLNLVDTVAFTGADGSVAYEGRVSSMPRDLGDRHSIGITLAGWMAHAKDRKFSEIYVDRDLSHWQGISVGRQIAMLVGNSAPIDGAATSDPTDNTPAITLGLTDAWAAPYIPQCEMWYDAGNEARIKRIGYSWKRNGVGSTAPWTWQVATCTDDKGTGALATGNLVAAGPSVGNVFVSSTAQRWGLLQLLYNSTPAGTAGGAYKLHWYGLAVYGDHDLSIWPGETGQPDGVRVSEVLVNIAQRWCPQLDTSAVEDNAYVIQHLSFNDRVFPYDAFLEINKYSLWHLAVWEGKKLTYRPYDLTDYDWEIRTDDPGTTFAPQGPSTESLFNGITVTYTNLLTGITDTLTPSVYTDLADTSTANPWNQHGVDHWDEITLSAPTLQATALLLGQAALADRNRPKTPGTITVRGYIRDRAGNEQPVWKVRAGDTISVTNFPNDTPRLIVETDYDDEAKTISLAIDKPFALLDAYLDRQQNALQAAGLA